MEVAKVQEIWLRNQEDIFSSTCDIIIWFPLAVTSGFCVLGSCPKYKCILLSTAAEDELGARWR